MALINQMHGSCAIYFPGGMNILIKELELGINRIRLAMGGNFASGRAW